MLEGYNTSATGSVLNYFSARASQSGSLCIPNARLSLMKIVSLSIYSILTTLMTDELTRQDDCYNESSQSLDADINFDSCNAEPSKMSHINNYDTEISELYKKYAAKMIKKS